MSLWGATRSIWYEKIAPASSGTFSLPVVKRDEPVYDKLIYQSPINGVRNSFHRGYHWVFEFELQLWTLANDTQRRTQIDLWMPWIGDSDFKLRRWLDGNNIEEVNGTDAFFTLEEAIPFYLSDRLTKDILRLRFYSNTYVQMDLSHP